MEVVVVFEEWDGSDMIDMERKSMKSKEVKAKTVLVTVKTKRLMMWTTTMKSCSNAKTTVRSIALNLGF